MATLSQLQSKSFSYNETNKKQLHSAAKKALKVLAEKLNLSKDQYDLRSNQGGVAVSGEITLHTDKLYIQISQSFSGNGIKVLYRTCKGRKDYSGGQNNFTTTDKLVDENFIKQLIKMSEA